LLRAETFIVFILGEIRIFWKTRNKSCARKGTGLKNVMLMKNDFSLVLAHGFHWESEGT
jgi:hypothetical protein